MANRPTPNRDHEKNAHLVDHLGRHCYGFLCAVARRSGVEEQAVDDVVQGALLDVLRSFPGPHETGHVAAYAARCVQRRASSLHRRHSRKESRHVSPSERKRSDWLGAPEGIGVTDVTEPEPLEIAIGSERTREMRALLDALPEDQRAALLLVAAGFGHEEVAERMGLTVRAVRKRIEKGNRRLRELCEGAD